MPVRSRRASRLKWTAFIVCVVLACAGALLGLRSPMLHIYEYQEDLYLSLDGSASLYISASIPALVALHGLNLSTDPRAPLDREAIRSAFTAPGVTVGSINAWRRSGRRFVTIRVDAARLTNLQSAAPFANDTFEFGRAKAGYRLVEQVGAAANKPVGAVGWNGSELIGYRWHIPSKIEDNNTKQENFLRGNILVWEQPLTGRLAGSPLRMSVDMQPSTILYSALWLFAISAGAALAVVVAVLWWVVRAGRKKRTSAV